MTEKVEVVGWVGGELISNAEGRGAREVVLALPLGRLLVRMVRVPADRVGDIADYLTPLLAELSPFPDEELMVGWETVSEDERGKIVLAAALPEGSAEDLAETLDAQKLRVTRLDALVLGELRALWPRLGGEGGLGTARRLLLLGGHAPETTAERSETAEGRAQREGGAALEMIVLDGEVPSVIRSLSAGDDIRREAMKCLLEAEDFGGAKPLAEIVTVGGGDALVREHLEVLSSLAPIRSVAAVSVQDSLEAIAARSEDAEALDARPASWREYLEETRFKAKLVRGVSAAVGVWLLAMGVLFGVPMTYGYMTDYQKGLSKRHETRYREVRDTKKKVELIQKYSDHARGCLEMIKAVSDRLPGDVELEAFDFKRADGVTFSGTADDTASVYGLKDALTTLEDSEENRIFGTVKLGRLSAAKGKQKFSLSCLYAEEEDDK